MKNFPTLQKIFIISLLFLAGCSSKNIGEPTPNLVRLLDAEDVTLAVKRVRVITYISDSDVERSKSVWEVSVTNHTDTAMCFKPYFKLIGMRYNPASLSDYSVVLPHTIKVIGYAEDQELRMNGFSVILPGYGELYKHVVRNCLTEEIEYEKIYRNRSIKNLRSKYYE